VKGEVLAKIPGGIGVARGGCMNQETKAQPVSTGTVEDSFRNGASQGLNLIRLKI